MCVNPDTMVGAMWLRHLVNLIFRSWLVMVNATSTNTLGFIIWTVALTAVVWFATVVQKFFDLRAEKVQQPFYSAIAQSARAGFYTCGAVIVLTLLAWAVACIVTVYQDHAALINQVEQLQEELRKRDQPVLTFRIKGWIANQDQDHNAIVQVWLAVDNSGEPETLRDWALNIQTNDELIPARHSIGQAPLKGGLNIPFLDKEFQRPVGTIADMQGYVTFVVPGIDQARFDKLYLDRQATLVVAAIDSRGRTIKAGKNIYETWTEGHRRTPAK